MYIRLFGLIFLSCLPGCTSQYPSLTDVPEYSQPSVSVETAQKEIKELRADRATNISG